MSAPRTSPISIACSSAFWGDTPLATRQILQTPQLDYIVSDYLSEVTMTILAKLKKRDPEAGYTADFFTDVIEPHLEEIRRRNIRLITNAGGLNPLALKKKIETFAASRGIAVRVSSVSGDDLLASRQCGEAKYISSNVYFGAQPIAKALAQGADIVVTGRVVDSALALGPAMHEFGWQAHEFDKLAQASLAGHIIECGTQCCGGNFTDWKTIPHPENVGFPIARIFSDGALEITKVPGTGGSVTEATVAEQIVYEIGDPRAYELPDVICDFSSVTLSKKSADTIAVSGARGRAPSTTYKALGTFQEGWKISTTAHIAGSDAKEKAQAIGTAIRERVRAELQRRSWGDFTETRLEISGGSTESLLWLSAAHPKPEALEILAKEIAPAATSLAPGLTSLLGGRASPTPRIRLESFLVPKTQVIALIDGTPVPLETLALPSALQDRSSEAHGTFPPGPPGPPERATNDRSKTIPVPLSRVAYARSGDKGNHVNIGVIARNTALFQTLKRELTPEKIRKAFLDLFDDAAHAEVLVWDLPGFGALNFLLKDCLGGGGAFSLRIDPQGKAYAQRLLELTVSVPEAEL